MPNHTITRDVLSNFRDNGKAIVYAVKGDKVTEIARHGEIVIVEGKAGRFAVKGE